MAKRVLIIHDLQKFCDKMLDIREYNNTKEIRGVHKTFVRVINMHETFTVGLLNKLSATKI